MACNGKEIPLNDPNPEEHARAASSGPTRIVIWCECGETPENALERYFLSFPEHRGPDYEIIVADWCGHVQPV